MRRWTLKVQPHLSELKCAAPGGAAGLVRFAAVGLRGTIPASRHYRVPRSNDRLLFNDLLPMNVLIGGQTKHTTPPYAVSSGVPDYRMAILRAKHKHTVSSQRVVMCKR